MPPDLTPRETGGAPAAQSKRILIAVHGVGAPAPGDVLQELLSAPQASGLPPLTRADLLVGGTTAPRAIATGPAPFAEIVEVNWNDLGWPRRGIIGIVRHLALLVLAMLRALPSKPGETDRQHFVQVGFRWYFESVFIWCIWPVLTSLLITCRPKPVERVAAVVTISIVLIAQSLWLKTHTGVAGHGNSRIPPGARLWGVGFLWLAACLIVAAGIWRDASPGRWITMATQVYVGAQLLTTLVLSLAVLLELFRWRTPTQLAASIGLMWMPVVAMTLVGSALWFVGLYVVDQNLLSRWTPWFLSALRYDLTRVEHAATLAIGSLPVLMIGGIALYGVGPVRSWRTGLFVQNWLSGLLIVAPFILAIPGVMLLQNFFSGVPGATLNVRTDVVEVYRESALRVVPYLVSALLPLAPLFDVLGDVAFFIVPAESKISILDRAVGRLTDVLAIYKKDKVVVIAYSQGCVIALEALLRHREDDEGRVALVTVGSPIASLYKRFLGLDFAVPRSHRSWPWTNVHRRGDYIAGPITAADDNRLHEEGRHLWYFPDEKVWTILREQTFGSAGSEAERRAIGTS